MTKVTTSIVLVSPKAIGSFGDESSWRIGLSCQVVDGGSNGPFLMCDMPGRTQHAIPWQDLSSESGEAALLFALCLYFGDGAVLGLLEDTRNVVIEGGELRIAPYYEFAPEVKARLYERIRDWVKIAFVEFEQDTSLTSDVLGRLEANGISVNRFARLGG